MLKIGIGQIAPVLLDRAATLRKVVQQIEAATTSGCEIVCFGEALVPGYPAWLSRTGGARFDDDAQKALHARYLEQGVCIEDGDLQDVQQAADAGGLMVVLGIGERAKDRGGHSLYCSAVVIGNNGAIQSVHRKLMPTYEERLCWGIGDGAGLVTHRHGAFTVGVLNCWENWMPMARAALHGQGEDLHIAVWPGSAALTGDITRFIAREGRSYVVSASGLLRDGDIPNDLPLREEMAKKDEVLQDGGSCIAGPDGTWVVEPRVETEELIVAELDPARVREERQNFDYSGHYARPDVLRLTMDRTRNTTVQESQGTR